jgi:signal transduction histidine kinase
MLLEVSDDGRGIAVEDVPRLFDRFYQVGGALRRVGDGFGLGLYITKRLVDALGGRISVDSEPGRGTTFTVWFPGARAAATEIA